MERTTQRKIVLIFYITLDSPMLKKIYHIWDEFHHILDNSSSVENAVISIDNWIEKILKLI
jgi:hypothetical protein